MGLSRFSISLGAGGRGHVVVNGEDVGDRLRRVTVDSVAGEVPVVFLELLGEGTLEGEGIVKVVKDLDPREVVVEFLSNVDPTSLENDALEKLGGLDGLATGQAFLDTLKGYVGVDNDGA